MISFRAGLRLQLYQRMHDASSSGDAVISIASTRDAAARQVGNRRTCTKLIISPRVRESATS